MRARWLEVALSLALTGTALAGPRGQAKPKPIDPSHVLDKLDVFRDDAGNYVVSARPGAFKSSDEAESWVFYGDRDTLYQQRVFGSSSNGANYEWHVWAPRSKANGAGIYVQDGKASLACETNKTIPLVQLKADEAKALIRHAKFLPPLWQRSAHLLARDDDGVYYYVDQLRDEDGGKGFRVFVGQKGEMKEVPMINIVTDSAGEIFATKAGKLKIIAGNDGSAFWVKKGTKGEAEQTKSPLTQLPPADNIYLIYRELGIYGPLGAPCDDR